MIKEGSYILCIEDILHFSNRFFTFIKGKSYKIHKVEENEEGTFYYTYDENGVEITLRFDEEESPFYSENFITLAEWRNIQIELILD